MKKFLFFTLFICSLNAFDDLGVVGNLYEVNEKNIKQTILENVKQLDKEKIARELQNSFEKAFLVHSDLPASKLDTVKHYKDFVSVPFDVINPESPNELFYKKGDTIRSDIGNRQASLCFVDGKNPILAKEIVNEFGKCDYMFANVDIRTIDYAKGYNIFPMHQEYVDRFKIEKLPVKLNMKNDTIEAIYLSVPRLIEQIHKRNLK